MTNVSFRDVYVHCTSSFFLPSNAFPHHIWSIRHQLADKWSWSIDNLATIRVPYFLYLFFFFYFYSLSIYILNCVRVLLFLLGHLKKLFCSDYESLYAAKLCYWNGAPWNIDIFTTAIRNWKIHRTKAI